MEFSPVDYIVIVVYLIGVAFLGLRASGKQTSTQDYFFDCGHRNKHSDFYQYPVCGLWRKPDFYADHHRIYHWADDRSYVLSP